jgi:hypothetical protein
VLSQGLLVNVQPAAVWAAVPGELELNTDFTDVASDAPIGFVIHQVVGVTCLPYIHGMDQQLSVPTSESVSAGKKVV